MSGWHRHPDYLRVRATAISTVLTDHALDLSDPGTRLIFSAHGTPLRYLEDGSRYVEYVETFCASVAAELKAPSYLLGYQNHTNRPGIRWTEPGIDEVIEKVEAKQVVVDAVSFMHEQSETLAELDDELREKAEARGLGFVSRSHSPSRFSVHRTSRGPGGEFARRAFGSARCPHAVSMQTDPGDLLHKQPELMDVVGSEPSMSVRVAGH